MRTTVALDDELMARAQSYTGVKEKSALIRLALVALVEREAARRLAALGGERSERVGRAAPADRSRVILVDTSIWVDHIRSADAEFRDLLLEKQVLMHPYVLGELALGSMKRRSVVIETLKDLPRAMIAQDDEVLHLIERAGLHGSGIGYVDAHLLASCRLSGGARLWTRDRRLAAAAAKLALAANPLH